MLRNHARGALNSAADLSLDVRWFYKCVSCTYTHTHSKCKYYSESQKNKKIKNMKSSDGIRWPRRRDYNPSTAGGVTPDRILAWHFGKRRSLALILFCFFFFFILIQPKEQQGAARSKRVGRLFSIATRHVLMDRWRIYPSANKYLPGHRAKQRFE